MGVCLKEFTPPPEPENKGLHEGVAQPVFNEAEHPEGSMGACEEEASIFGRFP